MELIVVTGLSGAGKSRAAAALEDMGIYCVDNMPVQLLPQLADVFSNMQSRYPRVALVTDIRAWSDAGDLLYVLEELRSQGLRIRVLYLYADMQTLVKRYKETRRRHPLGEEGISLEEAVCRERETMEPLRQRADYVIDTTHLSTARLRGELLHLFDARGERGNMAVSVTSFGFKYGLPLEADLVFDVRFMPNPYYVEELRTRTGLDPEVSAYAFSAPESREYLEKLKDLIAFSLPLYAEEGKTVLVIAVGCTGGHHRSVAVARELCEFIRGQGYDVTEHHRDMTRN